MRKAILTGNFDGMHKGHQYLFRHLQKEAEKKGLEPLAISFSPHTRSFREAVNLITTDEEKQALAQTMGVNLQILDFDHKMRALPPQQFIREVLVDTFNAGLWLIGYDHHFGAGGKGNWENSHEYAKGLGLEMLPQGVLACEDQICSSSAVRESVEKGEFAHAINILGHDYWIRGPVVHGDHLGTKLGFPTINLQVPPEKLLPAPGVYLGQAALENGQNFNCLANIGFRPTVSGKEIRVEAHILDFAEKIYGQKVTLKLNLALRKEKKFADLQALRKQIALDIQAARQEIENRNKKGR